MNLKRYLLPLLLLAMFLSTFILIQNSATETINEWTCRIDITETNGQYDYVIFGENVNATDQADTDYDIPNPPQPPPPILDAYFYNADYPVPYDKLMQDIKRYTTENVKKEWLLKIYWQNNQTTTVTLSWNNISLQQTEYNYITLYDIEAENRINMLENSQYNFQISPGQTRQFKITAQTQDIEPPINPTGWNSTHTIQEWSNKNMISVTWWGATDDLSGIAGYSYTWNNKSDTIPDETIDTTEPTCTSPPLTTGSNWYLHIRTVDKAGNWNPNALHIGPFYIDTDKPTITEVVQDPPGQEIPEHENVTVIATITDKGSGILNATLYYSTNNGTTWTPLNMTKTSQDTYQAIIPGYENCTWITYKIIAYDNAGNQASEDNNSLYYTYHVIPEIPSIPILLLELLLPVILLSIIKENQK